MTMLTRFRLTMASLGLALLMGHGSVAPGADIGAGFSDDLDGLSCDDGFDGLEGLGNDLDGMNSADGFARNAKNDNPRTRKRVRGVEQKGHRAFRLR